MALFTFAMLGCDGAPDPYVCFHDANCVRGSDQGQCLYTSSGPTACAFTDTTCGGANLRWDTSAPPSSAGSCVTGAIRGPSTADGGAGADMPSVDLLVPDLQYVPGQGITGDPCNSDNDCAPNTLTGARPTCEKSEPLPTGTQLAIFDHGYCSAPCDHRNNLTSGQNAACPGNGVCIISDQCRASCFTAAENCRPHYICKLASNEGSICLPSQYSQCDPTSAVSCATFGQDGGPLTDGGVPIAYACTNISPDQSAGQCKPACDPITAAGCKPGLACYVLIDITSVPQGTCDLPQIQGTDGDPCQVPTDCAAGHECNNVGGVFTCHAYCRTGSDPVPCTSTKYPVCSLFDKFDTDTLGACGAGH